MIRKNAKGTRLAHPLFNAVGKQRFGRSTCFLCGRRLGTRNRADEHVVPQWVLDRFQLRHTDLTLLNRTHIPYRQLIIPCCQSCNNDHLARLESEIQSAILEGFEATRALDQKSLFLWLGKIYYGFLLKELFLPHDRRAPKKGPIVPRRLLRRYEFHHLLLQAIRLPMDFLMDVPASVFVVPLKEPPDIEAQFDLRDSLTSMSISVRLGSVGLIGVLQDGGAQRDGLFQELSKYQSAPLHPAQFLELTAIVFYKASLFNRTPKFLIVKEDGGVRVDQMPLGGMNSKPLYDEWSHEEYARVLSEITGAPFDVIFQPPDRARSWLHDDDGNVVDLSFTDFPWHVRRRD